MVILVIAGVLGLYAQNRDTGRCGFVGLMMLLLGFAGIASAIIAGIAGAAPYGAYFGVLGWVFIPVAFILMGIGLRKPFGYAFLVVGLVGGCSVIVQLLGGLLGMVDIGRPAGSILALR